jgi:hypothetical protein
MKWSNTHFALTITSNMPAIHRRYPADHSSLTSRHACNGYPGRGTFFSGTEIEVKIIEVINIGLKREPFPNVRHDVKQGR